MNRDVYISLQRDSKYLLATLEHCSGVYRRLDDAKLKAKSILSYRIGQAKENLKYIEEYKSEY
jgi:hypothetical protein